MLHHSDEVEMHICLQTNQNKLSWRHRAKLLVGTRALNFQLILACGCSLVVQHKAYVACSIFLDTFLLWGIPTKSMDSWSPCSVKWTHGWCMTHTADMSIHDQHPHIIVLSSLSQWIIIQYYSALYFNWLCAVDFVLLFSSNELVIKLVY